jgi:hypothetical protein
MSLEAPGMDDSLRSDSSKSPNKEVDAEVPDETMDEQSETEAQAQSSGTVQPVPPAPREALQLDGLESYDSYYSTSAELGFYPDIDDTAFVQRLLSKTEFTDTKSEPFDPKATPCAGGLDFEVTPVQRFIATFMHPRTPYMSALLYHGVGVGKTCAAIQAAEAYLDIYPRKKVIIVCPRAIRQ